MICYQLLPLAFVQETNCQTFLLFRRLGVANQAAATQQALCTVDLGPLGLLLRVQGHENASLWHVVVAHRLRAAALMIQLSFELRH